MLTANRYNAFLLLALNIYTHIMIKVSDMLLFSFFQCS